MTTTSLASQLASVLKVAASAIKKFERWATVWFVVVAGKGARFVSLNSVESPKIMTNVRPSNKALDKLLATVIKKASYNSQRDEFYCDYRVGAKQKEIVEKACKNYRFTGEDGKVWEVNFSSRWNSQLPLYFYGQCHSL